MSMPVALVFYIIIMAFVFISVSVKKNRNRDFHTNTQKPFQKTSYNRPTNPIYNKQRKLTEKDIFHSQKKSFHPFNPSHEIDCGLDERIFGPRNQHKDIF